MSLRELAERVRRGATIGCCTIRVPDDNALNGRPPDVFTTGESYLEIRLTQMLLRDAREYWVEYMPIASVLTECIYESERRIVPFVVGPELLEGATHLRGGGVEYINTRVFGPTPYVGDDVDLLATLTRVRTGDWVRMAISFVESIGKVVDVAHLTPSLQLADPILTVVEKILGMPEVETRLARRYAYVSPTLRDPHSLGERYEVLMRGTEGDLTGEEEKFWVREGRLFYGESRQCARPFRDRDYLLLHIRPLTVREDYMTFDFHRRHWEETRRLIWAVGDEEGARRRFTLLAADLASCPDITLRQRASLLLGYRERLEEQISQYKQACATGPELGYLPTSTRETEEELQSVAQRVSDPAPRSPADLLALVVKPEWRR